MESGIELSEEIKMKLEPLLERVLQKLKEWGVDIKSTGEVKNPSDSLNLKLG
jgi:hypothetical protein